jgi:hypothetical protein
MKLFRYRPLNEFLFKELLYQEIYRASPHELNDPLDLNTQVNFYSTEIKKLKSLSRFIGRIALISQGITGWVKIRHLFEGDHLAIFLEEKITQLNTTFINMERIIEILNYYFTFHKINDFNTVAFTLELKRIISKFLNNSSISCFSEANDDFLMWSHYASSHSGICLEFEVTKDALNDLTIPMVLFGKGKSEFMKWGSRIQKVEYKSSLSSLDFYSFLPVFNNENDTDLMNLSKSHWHPFANELQIKFSEKLIPWASEREWRIVNISFLPELPEERINTFDLEYLTSICFGANTPKDTKSRIIGILNKLNHHPVYYQAQVDGTRGVIINHAEIED